MCVCSVSIPSSVALFAVFFGSFVNLQLHLHLQKVSTHPKMLTLSVYVSISHEQTVREQQLLGYLGSKSGDAEFFFSASPEEESRENWAQTLIASSLDVRLSAGTL